METEDDTAELKGARKRKAATVTRIIQNSDKPANSATSYSRLELEHIQQTNSFNKLENQTSRMLKMSPKRKKINQSTESEKKITIIQRSLGLYNNIVDGMAQKSPLNTSVINGPPFHCVFCKNVFYFGYKLKLHYILNHKCFHCDMCGTLFETENERNTHAENIHTIVQCEICQDELNRHEISFHYEEDHDAVACAFCTYILCPKSSYKDHLLKAHSIRKSYTDGSPMVDIDSEDNTFSCCLCSKGRETDAVFGHMKAYHKMGTTQFMNLLVNQGLKLKIDGAIVNEHNSSDDENTKKLSKPTCEGCKMEYNDKIQCRFHQVYCLNRVQCFYCYNIFESTDLRENHNKKHHSNFFCIYNCKDISLSTEELLNNHLLTCHDILNCQLCDQIFSPNKIEQHLLTVHKVNAIKSRITILYEVKNIDKRRIICTLCEEDITLLVDNVNNIFNHFYLEHSLSIKKILRLITPKPLLSDFENDCANKSTSNESEHSEIDEEKNTSLFDKYKANSKDYEFNNDKNATKKSCKVVLETDIDYENVEGIFDSEDEENKYQICEICNIENISLLDFIIHLKDKHKINTKYTEHKCKLCFEIELDKRKLEEHIVKAHSRNEYSVEVYDCGCEDKPYVSSARRHVLEEHDYIAEDYHLSSLGYKCRFCNQYFWKQTEQNEHEIYEHLKENESKFIKCPVCYSSFINQVCIII